ncbi:MAG: hypothetical protein J5I94_15930 [Phaeodactylibacter sp.]|nr:hypothetical protein [Phaeodactylibacter sp.]
MASIQDLLAKGETARALAQLQEHIFRKAPKWRQPVLLLRASWAQLEKERLQGIINQEQAELHHTSINAAALHLLESVDSGLARPDELWLEFKGRFWNEKIAETMKKGEPNNNELSSTRINIHGNSNVAIGSGNTIRKRIFNVLKRWKFWSILVMLSA